MIENRPLSEAEIEHLRERARNALPPPGFINFMPPSISVNAETLLSLIDEVLRLRKESAP